MAAIHARSVLGALLILGACGGSTDTDLVTSRASQPEVMIEGIAFEPDDLVVEAGDTVTWRNEDPVDHTVTSGKPGEQGIPGVKEGTKPTLDGLFDHALARAGSTFTFTFEERGTYLYFCRVHAAMKGVVIVE